MISAEVKKDENTPQTHHGGDRESEERRGQDQGETRYEKVCITFYCFDIKEWDFLTLNDSGI